MKWLLSLFLHSFLFFGLVDSLFAVEIGEKAPNCLLEKLNETQASLRLNQFQGQVIYLDFWASWCGPCAKSFPYMNGLQKSLKQKGLNIIAVNLDENRQDANDFLYKLPADFTVVIDVEQQCAKDFDVQAMPSSYLIDASGIVRYIHLGFRAGEVATLGAEIDKLLNEAPLYPVSQNNLIFNERAN